MVQTTTIKKRFVDSVFDILRSNFIQNSKIHGVCVKSKSTEVALVLDRTMPEIFYLQQLYSSVRDQDPPTQSQNHSSEKVQMVKDHMNVSIYKAKFT